jgi:IMP dehydrogenase
MNFSQKIIGEGLTFDNVLVLPAYSDVIPVNTDTETYFTKNIKLKIPIVSAAMDTLTEHKMAIAIAEMGGIGIIHKNLTIEQQAQEVKNVKEYSLSSGIASSNVDSTGKLRVGAAIGTSPDTPKRAKALVEAGVDALVIDTAHGHTKTVMEMAKYIKNEFPNIDLVVGNIATPEAAHRLAEIGVDAVKVGIGPGSICTTRIVAGIGIPQLTAILEVVKAMKGIHMPIIADGGIRYSGDIVKAIAAGASSVMLGSLLAATDETPGDIIAENGEKFKTYRGMGSVDAMQHGSHDRYFQKNESEEKKFVPEGVVGRLRIKGSVKDVLYQLVGGLKSGMGYTGSHTIGELQQAQFVKITSEGLRESHVHDITITKQPDNYK